MKKREFIDASVQGPNGKNFCYRTGLMTLEESMNGGVLVFSGTNTAGYPLNVLSNCPSRLNPAVFSEPSAFSLEIDGESCERGWKFVSFDKKAENSALHCILTLESALKPLRLYVHTLLDGTQMISRWLEIENKSDKPMALSRLGLLGGGLEARDFGDPAYAARPEPTKMYSLGFFANDGSNHEGEFVWRDLDCPSGEKTEIDFRFGRDRHRHPLLFIRNNETGVIYFSQIGWTGGCRYTVDHNTQSGRNGTNLSFRAEITGYHPLTIIKPMEKFISPEAYFGVVSGGLDEAVSEMHAHIRRSVLNLPEADGSACLVGAGMGPEHDMSVETTKSFMRQMAKMGAEVFIIDAGWFCPPGREISEWGSRNGTNVPDPDRYPGESLGELRELCHSLGMKFGMWVEIERLGDLAPVCKSHPEWFATNLYGRKNASGFIDLTVPEAAEWAENEVARIITEYGLDLLRVDNNVSILDAFRFRDLGSGREECLALRHFDAVYKMYGNLKKRFPDVIFENCASGGARTDLGIMRSFQHTWVSDNQKAPRSLEITNGLTMALPPERVDRLFAGMGCHAYAPIETQMRNTMLGHISLNVIAPTTAEVNSEVMDFVKHSVALYKNFIREIIPTSEIVHHTPTRADVEKKGFRALEIHSPDKSKGAMTVFAAAQVKTATAVVYPRGISAGATYNVTLDNDSETFELSGAEILRSGISVCLPAALSSELILWEKV